MTKVRTNKSTDLSSVRQVVGNLSVLAYELVD